jgi:hypothetical protein
MRSGAEERRQHKRYKIQNSISISSEGIFQITDISRGGFCFRCPPYTAISVFWETDILASGDLVSGVHTKRAWVSVTENGTHEYLPTIVGAKFGRLTKEQDLLLSQIINAISQGNDFVH